jgi:GTPase
MLGMENKRKAHKPKGAAARAARQESPKPKTKTNTRPTGQGSSRGTLAKVEESVATGPFRAGFAAIVGRPNVGKSTLVNRLVGTKVSIVTSRPQTTRNRILGIVNRPGAQVVLIDTPGMHRPSTVLGRHMMDEVAQALEGINLVAVMIDASAGITREDRFAIQRLRHFPGPVFLLLNKIDRISKPALLPLLEACAHEKDFAEMIPISALSGDGVEVVLRQIIARFPEAEPLFPLDQTTDQPERFLAAEIVREKAMASTVQEVPQAVGVIVESYEESPRLLRISAVIQVEREGQKGILIGRGGEKLKAIGTAARLELEALLGTKVFLSLLVKVERDWLSDPRRVRMLDWRRQLEAMAGDEDTADVETTAADEPDAGSDIEPEGEPETGDEDAADVE